MLINVYFLCRWWFLNPQAKRLHNPLEITRHRSRLKPNCLPFLTIIASTLYTTIKTKTSIFKSLPHLVVVVRRVSRLRPKSTESPLGLPFLLPKSKKRVCVVVVVDRSLNYSLVSREIYTGNEVNYIMCCMQLLTPSRHSERIAAKQRQQNAPLNYNTSC